MKTSLDPEDVELIARRVVDILKPFLSHNNDSDAIIFSVEELAAYIRVSPKWVYDHKYELPHFKPGGLLRFRKKDIDKEIDKLFLRERAKKIATKRADTLDN